MDKLFEPMTTLKAIIWTVVILGLLTTFSLSVRVSVESKDLAQLLSIGMALFLGRTIFQIWSIWDMDR